jgi:hypothetical protein
LAHLFHNAHDEGNEISPRPFAPRRTALYGNRIPSIRHFQFILAALRISQPASPKLFFPPTLPLSPVKNPPHRHPRPMSPSHKNVRQSPSVSLAAFSLPAVLLTTHSLAAVSLAQFSLAAVSLAPFLKLPPMPTITPALRQFKLPSLFSTFPIMPIDTSVAELLPIVLHAIP